MPKITESDVIKGVQIVEPQMHGDERGFFIETYRREWFPLGREMIQGNRGDRKAGAIVGLHYHLHQADYWYVPYGTCRVVLHDLRKGSPTDGATQVIDLGARNDGTHDHRGVFIPPGVAHGFASIFVTGGAGFIGSNYARWVLRNTDHSVTVYDALTYAGNLSTMRDLDDNPRFSFVKGNICHPGDIEAAMAGHDWVVHFAAESHVDRSIASGEDFILTNCFGTNVVVDTARRLGMQRVVHIGTDEVYGSVEVGSSKETDPLEPRSPYSASKAGSDLIALSYHSTHGTPVLVTRCTNNFGPWQYPEKAIPLFTTNLLDGKKIPLYGDGLNERDWLFVDDHCSGVHLVLEQGVVGEIYNIGAGNETPNRVLVDKLLALHGKDESSVQYVQDRKGHDRRYSVDISKITKLGWKRQRSLDEALDETVRWYRDNRWWWEPLKAKP
ncbi:MAG: dTDP-glucose 4,6-dehydratase [Actinobacteria bacterium]|nr:dTDP-glucose 4,6-dehydratase [Actinomycetota bacterium]